MLSHLQAAIGRVQELESRLGMTTPAPQAPEISPTTTAAATGVNKPFDVMLAQAGGNVQLQGVGTSAGPFSAQTEALATKYAALNGLPPELVRAVIQQESGGDTRSLSSTGAKGLMQLMPETANAYGVTDAFDPEQNIAAGTRHLAGLLREFNGDQTKALAAYNAGSAAVRKYGGIPPFPETQQYVQHIQAMLGH